MTSQPTQPSVNTIKFHNAEQLWFWFVYSKFVRAGYMHSPAASNQSLRVCEVLDVETLVTKLYLAGQLNDEHLNVMKEFGDKRRAPHQHIWSENKAAAIWRDAMQILDAAARARGWMA